MQLSLRIERRAAPLWFRPLAPVIAIVITFLLTAFLVVASKANPFEAYYYFLIYPLTSSVSAIEVLVSATPLLFTGAAACFAFSAGYWNIGMEGQLLAGAMAGAGMGLLVNGLPPWIAIPLMILAGFAAGLLWALIPALLKVKLAVDEIVTTLLMSTIFGFIVSYILNGVWRSPTSGWPQSPEIAPSAHFPQIIPGQRVHLGFLLALASLAVIWVVLNRTPLGLRMRANGLSQEAARFAGVKVERTMLIAALVSGGIAGLAGVSEVAGIQYHLVGTLSNNFGLTGVIVAMLGGLNPIGVAIAALFLGLIGIGAQSVSQWLGVPVYLGDVVEAAMLLVTLAMLVLQNYRIRRVG
jgi:simple sugar transport system permease protein